MEMGRHRCTGAIPGTPPHIHRGHPLLRLTRRRREGVRGVGGGSGRGACQLGRACLGIGHRAQAAQLPPAPARPGRTPAQQPQQWLGTGHVRRTGRARGGGRARDSEETRGAEGLHLRSCRRRMPGAQWGRACGGAAWTCCFLLLPQDPTAVGCLGRFFPSMLNRGAWTRPRRTGTCVSCACVNQGRRQGRGWRQAPPREGC